VATAAERGAANSFPASIGGRTLVRLPVSWEITGYSISLAVLAAAIFACFAQFSKVVVAQGQLAAASGSAPIVPAKAGVITKVFAAEGSLVQQGAPLLEIRSGTYLRSGELLSERIRADLLREEQELAHQQGQVQADGEAQLQQARAQIAGLVEESASLSSQAAAQRKLVASAAEDLQKTAEVARKGFISAHEQQLRADLLVSRQVQLQQVQQAREAKLAAMREARARLGEIQAKTEQQLASLASRRAQIGQQHSTNDAGDSYIVTAPVTGTVTAVIAQAGQFAASEQALMIVVPRNGSLEARLNVPSDAIGFVSEGQQVKLAVDAFPYSTFGTLPATVTSVARAGTRSAASDRSFYLVTAALGRQTISAFGSAHGLKPGMTLTARIATQKRSLFAWLFEPVLAVEQR